MSGISPNQVAPARAVISSTHQLSREHPPRPLGGAVAGILELVLVVDLVLASSSFPRLTRSHPPHLPSSTYRNWSQPSRVKEPLVRLKRRKMRDSPVHRSIEKPSMFSRTKGGSEYLLEEGEEEEERVTELTMNGA